jgi:hypothetical protein
MILLAIWLAVLGYLLVYLGIDKLGGGSKALGASLFGTSGAAAA